MSSALSAMKTRYCRSESTARNAFLISMHLTIDWTAVAESRRTRYRSISGCIGRRSKRRSAPGGEWGLRAQGAPSRGSGVRDLGPRAPYVMTPSCSEKAYLRVISSRYSPVVWLKERGITVRNSPLQRTL